MPPRPQKTTMLVCLAALLLAACRGEDDATARRMCAEAEDLDATDGRQALILRRKIWEELPTTGTKGAQECLREVRRRMGEVRSLVAHDTAGVPEAVDGCEWAAQAVDVFSGSANLPYRGHWARRLMERCFDVVGRAWTRDPDDERLRRLSEQLSHLSKKK